MSVAGSGNVLGTRAVFHSQDALSDHLAGVGAWKSISDQCLRHCIACGLTHDVHAENTVGLLLDEELNLALGVDVRLGTGVGREGELSDLVLHAGRLELLLGLTNPGNLGVCVDDRGDSLVVDVPVAGLDVFDGSNTLLLSLVREHGAEGHVADALDARDRGVELVIDDNAALGVNLNPNLLESETLGVGPPSDRDKNDVRFQLMGMSSRGQFERLGYAPNPPCHP